MRACIQRVRNILRQGQGGCLPVLVEKERKDDSLEGAAAEWVSEALATLRLRLPPPVVKGGGGRKGCMNERR